MSGQRQDKDARLPPGPAPSVILITDITFHMPASLLLTTTCLLGTHRLSDPRTSPSVCSLVSPLSVALEWCPCPCLIDEETEALRGGLLCRPLHSAAGMSMQGQARVCLWSSSTLLLLQSLGLLLPLHPVQLYGLHPDRPHAFEGVPVPPLCLSALILRVRRWDQAETQDRGGFAESLRGNSVVSHRPQ